MLYNRLSPTGAINLLSKLTHASRDGLFRLFDEWADNRTVYVHETDRGAAAPTHINHSHHFESEHVAAVHEYIYNANASGKGCVTSDIINDLKDKFNIIVELRTMRNVLHDMGYQYRKAKIIGKLNDSARCSRIRTYVIQYNLALTKQFNCNNVVIVYTDESYVNTGYGTNLTWINESTSAVVRPAPTGKRIVILHAITSDGLLVSKNHTAELFYEVKKNEVVAADYHDNMNGDLYLKWMREKLIPTFKEKYPNKKMVLVLDNAKYHHVIGNDYIRPSDMKKPAVAKKLREFGINEFTVQRRIKGTNNFHFKTFQQNTYDSRGSDIITPTVEELKKELKNYLLIHPEVQITEVQKVMKEHDYELIYTPPYLPNVQPIELIWSYVKHQVARAYTHNRSTHKLLDDVREAFYGQHRVTAELCKKYIEHCHKWLNDWIANDDVFRGSIDNLTSAVVAQPLDFDEDIDDEMEQQDLEAIDAEIAAESV